MTPNERESGDKSQHSKCVSRLEFNAVNARAIESGADKAGTCDYVAMWIDTEVALSSIEEAWKHLANVTTVPVWQKPDGANDDQVLFMTTCMETWIVADRKTL